MRVLILSVTAGGGHNSTAQAIKTVLDNHAVECRILDTFEYISKPLAKTVSEGYLFITSKAKLAFEEGYRLAERRKRTADEKSNTRRNAKLLSRKLRRYLVIYDPDVIIYTHIFAGVILDVIKAEHGLRAKTVGILTDFVFHPYWEEAVHLDYVVTACDQLGYQAKKKGFSPEQILPMGIPVQEKFTAHTDAGEVRAELGLDREKTTLLLMGGSMGYGNIAATVESLYALDADFQLIVVCGSNEKAKEEVDALPHKKPTVTFGWSREVDRLMDAADLIITKPGGLTTSESLAKRLPMIIVNPIPGQEDRNTEFLLNQGAALAVTDTFPLDEAVWSLLSSPERVALMRAAIDRIRRPNASADIARFVMQLGEVNEQVKLHAQMNHQS
ncbi:MAG: galactosyldiacylglycerol synthase [Clostridia bacterium]|nr:galactosyldiacylglycerol synthase [Clostridia bacterium]